MLFRNGPYWILNTKCNGTTVLWYQTGTSTTTYLCYELARYLYTLLYSLCFLVHQRRACLHDNKTSFHRVCEDGSARRVACWTESCPPRVFVNSSPYARFGSLIYSFWSPSYLSQKGYHRIWGSEELIPRWGTRIRDRFSNRITITYRTVHYTLETNQSWIQSPK